MEADEVAGLLGLKPLPGEGGLYRETFRAAARVPTPRGERSASTTILYLLAEGHHSALHRLPFEEAWHFHRGDPVEMLLLHPGGRAEEILLGHDIEHGMRVQVVVPAGCWQGARLRAGGRWALFGITMAPGFEFEDWEAGDPEALSARWPARADRIRELAPGPGGGA